MHLKKKPFDPHIRWFNRIEEMKMMWEFWNLVTFGDDPRENESEGTHTICRRTSPKGI